jgi:iron complex outermembrane receptor protein
MEMKKFLFFISFFSILFANDITFLLNEIEKKEDLSQKTKIESVGISYVITRYQLEMMQAKTLKDVLNISIIGDGESRYGLVDPWHNAFIPYSSFGVRVFLDNQELVVSDYDNSLFLLSKIDISFVDHIEIYYMMPSYSLTNEPAYVIIKLYTKKAKRDEGIRIAGSYGTFKTNIESLDYLKFKIYKNYSVFFHLSRTELNHKKYFIGSSLISRDSISKHFFWKMYNDTTKILLNTIFYDQDAFLGPSFDGDIKNSQVKIKNFHLGIDRILGSFSLKYSLDYSKNSLNFVENNSMALFLNNINMLKGSDYAYVNSLKAKYSIKNYKNDFVFGIGIRNKVMDFDYLKINNAFVPYNKKKENILNFFFEENYFYKVNSLFSVGSAVSKYFRDDKNYFVKQFRIGNTFLFKKNVFKIFYQHIEFLSNCYLNDIIFHTEPKIQKTDVLIGKIKHNFNDKDIELVSMISRTKNIFYYNSDNGYDYLQKYIPIKMFSFRYHKNYNIINDFTIEYNRMYFYKLRLKRIDKLIFLNTHRKNQFEFFESGVYQKNIYKDSTKKGIELNLGIKYNVGDNFSLALKGNNILNKAYKISYPLINLNNFQNNSIDVPVVERSLMLSVEYLF